MSTCVVGDSLKVSILLGHSRSFRLNRVFLRGGYIFYPGAMEMFVGKGLEYFFAACTAKFSLLTPH